MAYYLLTGVLYPQFARQDPSQRRRMLRPAFFAAADCRVGSRPSCWLHFRRPLLGIVFGQPIRRCRAALAASGLLHSARLPHFVPEQRLSRLEHGAQVLKCALRAAGTDIALNLVTDPPLWCDGRRRQHRDLLLWSTLAALGLARPSCQSAATSDQGLSLVACPHYKLSCAHLLRPPTHLVAGRGRSITLSLRIVSAISTAVPDVQTTTFLGFKQHVYPYLQLASSKTRSWAFVDRCARVARRYAVNEALATVPRPFYAASSTSIIPRITAYFRSSRARRLVVTHHDCIYERFPSSASPRRFCAPRKELFGRCRPDHLHYRVKPRRSVSLLRCRSRENRVVHQVFTRLSRSPGRAELRRRIREITSST